jgi:hypothetical protein
VWETRGRRNESEARETVEISTTSRCESKFNVNYGLPAAILAISRRLEVVKGPSKTCPSLDSKNTYGEPHSPFSSLYNEAR